MEAMRDANSETGAITRQRHRCPGTPFPVLEWSRCTGHGGQAITPVETSFLDRLWQEE